MEIIMSYGRCLFASQHGQLSGNHFLTITEGLEDLYDFGRKSSLRWSAGHRNKFDKIIYKR